MNQPITNVCLFIRVSSFLQDAERQHKELTEYCTQRGFNITKIISTTITGKREGKKRPDLQELFKSADEKMFDKVIITEISRLGRRSKDIRNTIDYLHSLNIPIVFKMLGGLESLDENGNETLATNIIIAVYAEVAQEEIRVLSERTKSGLALARSKGKTLGRPIGQTDAKTILKQYSKLVIDLNAGLSLSKCMAIHSVSKNTVIKVKKLLTQSGTKEAA